MSKEYIRQQIVSVKRQINNKNCELRELEEKLDVLMEFSEKCNRKADSFQHSVQQRKRKLSSLGSLIDRIKSVAKYNEQMSGLLNGSEYNKSQRSIDDIMDKISEEKRKLMQKISTTESDIKNLNYRLRRLQYQYNNYKEET